MCLWNDEKAGYLAHKVGRGPKQICIGSRERRKIWLEGIGIEPPDWEDDALAPPVDERALRAFVRNELSSEAETRVLALALHFRSWATALCRARAQQITELN